MSAIEELVRRSLHDRVAEPPPMRDPAERAVRGARAIRRRRSLLGGAAVGAALVVVLVSVGYLRGMSQPMVVTPPRPASPSGPPASPSGPPTPARAAIAALADGRVLLPDGSTFALTNPEAEIIAAYDAPDGFVVSARPTKQDQVSVWLIGPAGSSRRLLTGLDAPPVLAPDGRHLAWRSGATLYTGHLDADGTLTTDRTSPAPERGVPVAVAGSSVVLGYSRTGGRIDKFDLWRADQGRYTASWDRYAQVLGVYAAAPDGRSFLALVNVPASGEDCPSLAKLDAETLRLEAAACGIEELTPAAGAVSPDGRWLSFGSYTPEGERLVLVDLGEVFRRPAKAVTRAAAGPGVWEDTTTVVAIGPDGRPVRFRVDRAAPEPYPVLGWPAGGRVSLVPRLP